MTTLYIPNKEPVRGQAFSFFLSLISQADTDIFQVNPTLAAGDVLISIDGGAQNNITTLPVVTPAGSKIVKVDLSAAEMTGTDIIVLFSDVAGNEWQDVEIIITTVTPTPLTLAMNIASIMSVASGEEIQVYRGDTLDLDIDYLGDLTGWTKIWFTIKHDKDDTDAQAILQLVESNPGVATDGLLYVEGAAPTAVGNGSITVTNVLRGNITIRVEALETAKLVDEGGFYYDIQWQTATDTTTLRRGDATIIGDVTRTV